MSLKKVFLALISLLLFSAHPQAGANPSIKGIYTQLSGHQFRFDGKTVEVIEFLSFYCHTCYNFEKSIPIIKGNFPGKIRWKTIPIYWGKGSTKPGEAYLLAREAGKGDEMKKALFKAQMLEKRDIGDLKVLETIGRELGLGKDFSRRLRAGEKTKNIHRAMDMAKEFHVDETPTLIIAGNIMTNPHPLGHNMNAFTENVILILKSILQQ